LTQKTRPRPPPVGTVAAANEHRRTKQDDGDIGGDAYPRDSEKKSKKDKERGRRHEKEKDRDRNRSRSRRRRRDEAAGAALRGDDRHRRRDGDDEPAHDDDNAARDRYDAWDRRRAAREQTTEEVEEDHEEPLPSDDGGHKSDREESAVRNSPSPAASVPLVADEDGAPAAAAGDQPAHQQRSWKGKQKKRGGWSIKCSVLVDLVLSERWDEATEIAASYRRNIDSNMT
jgi:hypothetical protein